MRKGFFLRVAVGFVLLTVVFTQAGINFLHSHQGMPEHHLAWQSAPDSGNTCQACAVAVLPCSVFAEEAAFFLPSFSEYSFDEIPAVSPLFSYSAASVGRAPPVC